VNKVKTLGGASPDRQDASAMKFDATLKTLLEESPGDWPVLAGQPPVRVDVIDADVSTVSGATDKVLRLHGPPPSIMHFDFQAGPDASVPRRLNTYSSVLEDRHELPVRSVVVLLRPAANLSTITGTYQMQLPGDPEPYRTFRYKAIRVWRLPTEPLLAGGPGTLPLAPISAVAEPDVPGVVQRMKERLGQKKYRGKAERLWAATYVLLGLRYEQATVDRLLQGVLGMKESVTYQAIVEEGRAEGRNAFRKALREQGELRFGKPAPPQVATALEAVNDWDELQRLSVRLLQVQSWEEWLTPPRGGGRRRKRKP
jgi:predicted transposase YdaD